MTGMGKVKPVEVAGNPWRKERMMNMRNLRMKRRWNRPMDHLGRFLKKQGESPDDSRNSSKKTDKSPNDGQKASKKGEQKRSESTAKEKSRQSPGESGTLKRKADGTSKGSAKNPKKESRGKGVEKQKDLSKVKEGDVMAKPKKSSTSKKMDDEPQQGRGDSREPPDTSLTCDEILDGPEKCVH